MLAGLFGQLGNGDAAQNSTSPMAIDTTPLVSEIEVRELASNSHHNCMLTANGTPWCWGSDTNGELGNGGWSADAQSPVQVVYETP